MSLLEFGKSVAVKIESYPKNGLEVLIDPYNRQNYLDTLLTLEGLSHIKEDPLAAYCPISLTNTPDGLKPLLQRRQQTLMSEVLKPAGITAYDPAQRRIHLIRTSRANQMKYIW